MLVTCAQYWFSRDSVFLRRMLFFSSGVAVVALLIAVAALFLAISEMKGKQSYAY